MNDIWVKRIRITSSSWQNVKNEEASDHNNLMPLKNV